MLLSLVYLMVRALFRLAPAGKDRERDLEILVLRHQLKVLKRKAGRPRFHPMDRLLLAAVARRTENWCAI